MSRTPKLPAPDEVLTREQAAAALSAAGYPMSATRLAGLTFAGEGPPCIMRPGLIQGTRRATYVWRSTLTWARETAAVRKRMPAPGWRRPTEVVPP